MEKFERQLPEALELVSRSLKAGHAFTGGLKMVAEEFGDPVGVEFGRTLDEINFGVGVPEALTNLTQRIECEDLKFFAVSVIIQRETGGNLAEILESLGRLIRERFKFQGRVRVLSGEGRISAIVLVAIPFFIAGLLFPDQAGIYRNIAYRPHRQGPRAHGRCHDGLGDLCDEKNGFNKSIDLESSHGGRKGWTAVF